MSGPLKKYKVVRNGFETVMKLSDADAAKLKAGPYQVSDAVSTIEPVAPVDEGGDDGGAEDQEHEGPAVADAGIVVSEIVIPEGVAAGNAGAAEVQPPAKPAGDGQAAGDVPSPSGDPGDGQAEVKAADSDGQPPAPAPAKGPAKRRATSVNKAQTSARTKAPGTSGAS